MLVKEIMTKDVITTTIHTTVREANNLMCKKRIRHLPVVDEDQHVVGIFTEHDVFQALDKSDDEEKSVMQHPVASYMTEDVISAHPDEFVEDLATIFYDYRIGIVPIIDKQKLVGIITRSDLLYTLIQLTGAHQPSSIIQVQVDNQSGMLADVAAIISKKRVNITSVLIYPGETDDTKTLLFRVQTMNPHSIAKDMVVSGYHVLWPQIERNSTTNE